MSQVKNKKQTYLQQIPDDSPPAVQVYPNAMSQNELALERFAQGPYSVQFRLLDDVFNN